MPTVVPKLVTNSVVTAPDHPKRYVALLLFGRPTESMAILFRTCLRPSNVLVQLRARYHHRGEAASEKCLSAATFVRPLLSERLLSHSDRHPTERSRDRALESYRKTASDQRMPALCRGLRKVLEWTREIVDAR